jgi:hypothetical protein
MVVVDADGLFAGVFRAMCEALLIPCEAVARENHKANTCEQFRRLLNKVQRINTSDTGTQFRWKQAVAFASYAWNAAPIDGTDLPRCVVAVGKDFPFPIDVNTATARTLGPSASQQAVEIFDARFPLSQKQRELLDLLNKDRRQQHRDLKNEGQTERRFHPGNLVILRKQVQSKATQGFSAKLVFRPKGPYRVIDEANPGTYNLQRLPFLQGGGKPGKIVKEAAFRMERIPSTLVLHKRTDGADSRFLALNQRPATAPLEKWLRVIECGAYKKAAEEEDYAFEKLANMWSNEMENDSDSDSDYNPDDANDEPVDDLAAGTEEATNTPLALQVGPRVLNRFYKLIVNSQDKLFLVREHDYWRLASVDLDETDPAVAKSMGIYRVRWYIPKPNDTKTLSPIQCQYWPEIRTDQGRLNPLRPEKVKAILQAHNTLEWASNDFPLYENNIVGPFDFTIPMQPPLSQSVRQHHCVDNIHWIKLEQLGRAAGISDEYLTKIRTLPKSKH